ncbi:MAG: thymidine kinase [Gammaproteobacteria bacterium RIFCSPHIGHO2_12_FULL_35_23]|nr:MAG: thymidine kinase [Gammaproteobacteria bacterium RIFCSPHIGHO2_12_FULL_35_23]
MAKLYFYYSAMNAGKSTILLQSSHNYQERGMDTLLFTPSFDNRYQVGKIASRIGLTANAIVFDQSFNFFNFIEQEIKKRPTIRCILIDEAQFLNKNQIEELSTVTLQLNCPVLAYGLRTDFLGEPFEGSKYLLAWAEELAEIKTICHCGRKATMNLRIDENGQAVREGAQVEIGGNDRYVATCRHHYLLGDSGRDSQQNLFIINEEIV